MVKDAPALSIVMIIVNGKPTRIALVLSKMDPYMDYIIILYPSLSSLVLLLLLPSSIHLITTTFVPHYAFIIFIHSLHFDTSWFHLQRRVFMVLSVSQAIQ